MSKIELSTISSGYNLSKMNENFQKLEDALNDEVLYRNNPEGEDNSLQTDVDANNKRILNLPDPVSASEPVRKQDLEEEADRLQGIADTSIAEIEDLRDEVEGFYSDAAALANYQGYWQTGVSVSDKGMSWSYADLLWICNTDGTTTDPSKSSSSWSLASSEVRVVSSISELASYSLIEDQAVELIGYHDGTTVGGGSGVVATARHNGGTAISLTRAFPSDWADQAQLSAWFADSGSDELCLVRTDIGDVVSAYCFGGDLVATAKHCKSNLKWLDARIGQSTVYETLDLTNVNVMIDAFSQINVDPENFSGDWAVTWGDPSVGFNDGRVGNSILLGNMVVNSISRNSALNGIYRKGSWFNHGHVRAVNFNGYGVKDDSVWDSTFQRVSTELCGNTTTYALWLGSDGDTHNTCNYVSVQVEQSYHKSYFINTLRSTINNIHAERTYQLLTNDGTTNPDGGTYLNAEIILSNSTIDQMVSDSATVNPPSGEINISQDYKVNISGDLSEITSSSVGGGVYNIGGDRLGMNELACSDLYQVAPATNTIINNPSIVTASCEGGVTFNQGSVFNVRLLFNAANVTYNNVEIDNIESIATTKGDIEFNHSKINTVNGTGVPTTGYNEMTLNDCNINLFNGAGGQQCKIAGGRINTANIADNAEVKFYDTVITTFNPIGNVRYLTKNVIADSVTSWSTPTNKNYPAGTLTERVGYNAVGKIYQNTDGLLTWSVVA